MPLYKDYINAFKLACVSLAEAQDYPAPLDNALASAYAEGYSYGMVACAMGVARDMDSILAVNEYQMPDICFTHPEEAVTAGLNDLMARYQGLLNETGKSSLLLPSRMFEKKYYESQAENLSGAFKHTLKMDIEHGAFDRGANAADYDFFIKILPRLIGEYQKEFDPEDHPYIKPQLSTEAAHKFRLQ